MGQLVLSTEMKAPNIGAFSSFRSDHRIYSKLVKIDKNFNEIPISSLKTLVLQSIVNVEKFFSWQENNCE